MIWIDRSECDPHEPRCNTTFLRAAGPKQGKAPPGAGFRHNPDMHVDVVVEGFGREFDSRRLHQ